MKKGVGSGSGSISQRYGSRDPDLDPHQNVTDPQHWCQSYSELFVIIYWVYLNKYQKLSHIYILSLLI
jgi:hypothetical protein